MFGSQITTLALPLMAVVLLNATPQQGETIQDIPSLAQP
mgnify:CR=1 FL=1